MKIRIKDGERDFDISVPDGLIFNRITPRIVASAARKYVPEAVEAIRPEAINVILAELNRIRRKHGAWVLVEVQSADGGQVTIAL